jgi:hypothetical protein
LKRFSKTLIAVHKNRSLVYHERCKTVADFTYDWQYWVDSEGKFLYVWCSCERITGYTGQEFLLALLKLDPDVKVLVARGALKPAMAGDF